MTTDQLKQLAITSVEDSKGQDIKVLDVTPICDFTDFMVICSGTSNRHVKAIADNIIEAAKESGIKPIGIEGVETAEWILIDLGDVVVHIMQPTVRIFYKLEQLWSMQLEKKEAQENEDLPRKKWK